MTTNKAAFTPSTREEIISALWIIAALLAWNGGIKWLACLLFIKGALDTVCSVVMGFREVAAELQARRNADARQGEGICR